MRALKTTPKPDLASPHETRSGPAGGLRNLLGTLFAAQTMRLPLLAPLGLATGAALYLTAKTEPSWPLLILSTLIAFTFTMWTRKTGRPLLMWTCVFVLTAALGASLGKISAEVVAAPVLSQEIGPSRIEGRLVEIDSNDRNRRLRLAVSAIEGLSREQTPRFVRFSYRYDIDFAPGRALTCTAILSPPPIPAIYGDYAFHRDAWFEQLGAIGFAVGRCTPIYAAAPSNVGDWLRYRIAAVRRSISGHVLESAGSKGGPIAAAMIAGDRSYIATEDVEALRGSGLAHLLAISGLHMAMAGGAFFIGLRLLWPFAGTLALKIPAVKIAAAGAIIGCTVYFLLSGGSIATQRAYIMALIAFSAKLIDKPALSLRSLAIAFGAIVMLHTEAVATPGFQMSFAASAALIGTFEAWPTRPSSLGTRKTSRVLAWISGAASTSITASLATMPFAIHHFDRAATLGILANLAVTPIISFWAAPSAAAALVASIFGFQDPFLASLGASLERVVYIAHVANDYAPDIHAPPIYGWTLVFFVIAIAAYSLLAGWGRLLFLPPLVVALFLWAQTERPVAYAASNGVIYVKTDESWTAVREWEKYKTLTPLKLDAPKRELTCQEGLPICILETRTGRWEFERTAALLSANTENSKQPDQASPCLKPAPEARFIPFNGGTTLEIRPCELPEGYSAEVYVNKGHPRLITKNARARRPWTP